MQTGVPMPGLRRRPLLGGAPFQGRRGGPAAADPARSNAAAQDALHAQPVAPESRSALLDEVSHDLMVFPGFDQAWHQGNDAMIANVVNDFNARKGWSREDPHWLDPNLVKAWAMQESGGDPDVFQSGDMMQVNNGGDWAREKAQFGLKKGEAVDPEKSLRTALEWAYYKGEVTRAVGAGGVDEAHDWHATERGSEAVNGYESQFQGWDTALENYNGGGVRDYQGQVERRLATGQPA